MTRTRVVVQSRLNSSRLPGKALMTIAGMPLIELVARRASRDGHEVIVATSEEQYDTRIVDHLHRVGIPAMRGSLDDVLGRFVAATQDLDDDDRVVRLTGDNPVGDSSLIDELIEAMDEGGFEYGRNDVSRMPEGLGCEVFRVRDLRRAAAQTDELYDREHVTPWLRRNVSTLDYVPKDNPGDPERFRCTVDVLSDYDRVCRLFADKSDPVSVPWVDLINESGGSAFTAGPSVPRRDDSELDQSVMILGGQAFAGPQAPSSTEIRAMLATAVNRGVNHVEVGRGDHNAEEILHKCGEPQLTQRLHFISRLREIRTNDPRLAAATVEAQLERSFAELGRRKASAVLMANVDEAHSADGTGWHRLRDYRESGEVGRIGVNVESLEELRRALELTDLGYVQFPLGVADRALSGAREVLADRDVVVTTHATFAGGTVFEPTELNRQLVLLAHELGRANVADLCVAYSLGHPFVDSIAVGTRSNQQMIDDLAYCLNAPLTADEVALVDDRLASVLTS